MDYEYRNIDTDIELLKAARKYWNGESSKEDVYNELANECYSKWEADRAINDYYYVHVWSQKLIYWLLNTMGIVGIIALTVNLILRFL